MAGTGALLPPVAAPGPPPLAAAPAAASAACSATPGRSLSSLGLRAGHSFAALSVVGQPR